MNKIVGILKVKIERFYLIMDFIGCDLYKVFKCKILNGKRNDVSLSMCILFLMDHLIYFFKYFEDLRAKIEHKVNKTN